MLTIRFAIPTVLQFLRNILNTLSLKSLAGATLFPNVPTVVKRGPGLSSKWALVQTAFAHSVRKLTDSCCDSR